MIAEDYEEMMFENKYFTLNGIDFFPYGKRDEAEKTNAADRYQEMLMDVLSRSYNIIIIDFGTYEKSDKITFERCENKLIVAGSKPWETRKLNDIFESTKEEILQQYLFCFNFTQEKEHKALREGMGSLKVEFLKYTEDPFSDADFTNAEEIFKDCLPQKQQEDKQGILQKIFRKKQKKEEKEGLSDGKKTGDC